MVKVNDKVERSQGSGPPLSMMSDGSFVVLERSTATPLPNGEQALSLPGAPGSVMAFPSTSVAHRPQDSLGSSFTPGSFPDLSPEEIQKKLTEVLQENVELKETLHQNNLAMKQQFNTLIKWQEEVFKVHQSHKEKFQETKELILKLRAENAELKNYLDMKSGTSSDAQLKAENAHLKGQVAELQQRLAAPLPQLQAPSASAVSSLGPTKKEEELMELAQRLTRQLETAERSKRQMAMEVESLITRRERAERELEEARVECSVVRTKLQQCEQDLQSYVCVEQGPPSDKVSAEEAQQIQAELERAAHRVHDLEQELQEQREACKHAEKQLQDLSKAQSTESGASCSFLAALRSCAVKMQELADSLTRQTERYASLDKWLQSAAVTLQPWRPSSRDSASSLTQLRSDIAGLHKVLMQEQAYGAEKKAFLDETQGRLERLFQEHEALMRTCQEQKGRTAPGSEEESIQRSKQSDAHDAAFRSQLQQLQAKGFSEQLDRLTAQVLCKEEELKIRDEEEKEMKEKIQRLERDNEAIAILKAQVEVYQSDFNAEREAREHLAGERERLSEDLRHLQRRNQQLLDEMEALQRTHFEQLQNAPVAAVPPAPGTPASGWNTIAAPGHGRKQASPELRHSPQVERHSPPKVYEEEVPPPKEFVCPLCKMSFRQLNLLEYHVETCLDS